MVIMIEIIAGIEVDVQKKPVKHVRLKVTRDGKVVLNIPNNRPKKVGVDFLLQKIDWVKDKLKNRPKKSPFSFKTGEMFYLFGNQIVLTVEKGVKNGFLTDGDRFIVYTRDTAEEKVKKAFESSLKEILLKRAVEYFDKWQNIIGLYRSSLTSRKTVSRWGSCNFVRKILIFNYALINAPIECVEYVVYHEFTHFIEPNHSKKFYLALSNFLPDYKQRKKELQKISILL